jgi:hypothetical protein
MNIAVVRENSRDGAKPRFYYAQGRPFKSPNYQTILEQNLQITKENFYTPNHGHGG